MLEFDVIEKLTQFSMAAHFITEKTYNTFNIISKFRQFKYFYR